MYMYLRSLRVRKKPIDIEWLFELKKEAIKLCQAKKDWGISTK
jgi:hypothetical protein